VLVAAQPSNSKDRMQYSRFRTHPRTTWVLLQHCSIRLLNVCILQVAADPNTLYPILIDSPAVSTLAGLLSHDNTDIAVEVMDLLQELTDAGERTGCGCATGGSRGLVGQRGYSQLDRPGEVAIPQSV
jgi:beta-catenin-like protein 1